MTNLKHLPVQDALTFNTFTMKKPLVGRVLSNVQLTAHHRAPDSETRHIVIASEGLKYVSGQSVGILPPGVDPRSGRPNAMRLYSVASCARGDDHLGNSVSLVVARHYWDHPEMLQKSVPGVCSQYLCDAKPGDEIKITGPVGKRFLLPADFMERDFVFVATGTGIAPFRGMLADMFDAGYAETGRHVTLVFGVPHADSILYDEEFVALSRHKNFHYVTAVSRGDDRNPYPELLPTRGNKVYTHIALWHHRDIIAPSVLKPDTVVYFCGLKGMGEGIQEVINHMGSQAGQPDLAQTLADQGRLLREVY